MKTAKQIKELIAQETAKVEALVQLATEEERDLTAEEQSEVDAIIGTDETPGRIHAHQESLKKAERIEKIVQQKCQPIIERHIEQQDDPSGESKITIPSKARRHGKLKAYTGPDAERNAYIAGHAYAAAFYGHEGSKNWLNEHGLWNALSKNDGNNSGIFVPVETETEIIRLVEEYGAFRQFADVEPMGSDRKVVPVRVGGMTAYPVAETNKANEATNTGTQSEPRYTNVELVARKWKAWLKMSDELNEDALISFADQVTIESALAFAYAEDNCGFNGDGTADFHGIVGLKNVLNAGSIHDAATGNTAFSTLDIDDFEAIASKLPDFPNIQPAWHITKEGYYASMHRLMMAAGGNSTSEIAAGGGRMFLGFPVVFNQVGNKTLTAQTDTILCYFGDLRMAAKFGDRRGVEMSLTDHRYWDTDQIAVKATERFDINIHSRGNASDPGAIMALSTPSS